MGIPIISGAILSCSANRDDFNYRAKCNKHIQLLSIPSGLSVCGTGLVLSRGATLEFPFTQSLKQEAAMKIGDGIKVSLMAVIAISTYFGLLAFPMFLHTVS